MVPGTFPLKLPEPQTDGKFSVERALFERKSMRKYRDEKLTLKQLSQILWACQGRNKYGRRCAPSAGASYPLEICVVAGNVEGLMAGVYRYEQQSNSLALLTEGDLRQPLSVACIGQTWIAKAAFSIVMCAKYEKTTGPYGERGAKYVHMDVGCAMENIHLQATALELGTVFVGAFKDEEVKRLLKLKEEPLAIAPVGKA